MKFTLTRNIELNFNITLLYNTYYFMEDVIKKWMQEWVVRTSQVKYENTFNEKSDEWIHIDGIGKFKGLEIVSEEHQDINEITIKLKYSECDKNDDN